MPLGDLPLYAMSPFSYFAIKKCHEYNVQINECFYRAAGFTPSVPNLDMEEGADLELNPYFNIPFLEYLLRNILPCRPMFDHSLMVLSNFSTNGDTNGKSSLLYF